MPPTPRAAPPGPPPAGRADTAAAVLAVARELAQQRGFHGFSYRDIAQAIGTTTTAVHYHFRSKDDLGTALVERYSEDFAAALDELDAAGATGFARLEAYRAIYQSVIDGSRLCLCAMFAAESETLPEATRRALDAFFDLNVRWLAAVVTRGRADGTVAEGPPASDVAETIVAGLEGAMLLAWSRRDATWFARVSHGVLAPLRAPATSSPGA